jgi:PKD repeat protein
MSRLLSDAGISVQMNYSPSGSGAYVITADDPTACAQISYVKYFNYSANILDGQAAFSNATAWQDTLAHDLDCNRPIQYVGADPSAGGHTWVCDGYDASYNFHMNWGWSGVDDGWYALNNLSPGGSYNFSQNIEALTGIMPGAYLQAAFVASPLYGCMGQKVTYTDQSVGQTTTPVAWKWSFPGGTPSSSTAQNPVITYNSSGTYNVTEIVTDNTGAKDTLIKTAYITVEPNPGNPTPLAETFQASTFPSAEWIINNPSNHITTWALSKACGGFGKSSQCMYYNNYSGGIAGNYDQIFTPSYNFASIGNPKMYFDVAYAPYDGTESDTLAIYYSTDCGATWNNVYLKGGLQLGTYSGYYTNTSVAFVPTGTQWRTDTVNIPAIAGQPDVMFSIENRSGNGFSMYIDNINIPGMPTAVFNPASVISATVYPNPNNGSFTVQLTNAQDKQQFTVYNVLGQQVYSAVLFANKTQVNINEPTGLYFYRIQSLEGKMVAEGKLMVK